MPELIIHGIISCALSFYSKLARGKRFQASNSRSVRNRKAASCPSCATGDDCRTQPIHDSRQQWATLALRLHMRCKPSNAPRQNRRFRDARQAGTLPRCHRKDGPVTAHRTHLGANKTRRAGIQAAGSKFPSISAENAVWLPASVVNLKYVSFRQQTSKRISNSKTTLES